MIKKLLVAIDGSSHSMKAVDYAAEIAAGCGASMLILSVIRAHQTPKVSAELRAYAELEHIAGSDMDAIRMLSKDLVNEAEVRARDRGAKDIVTKVETGPVARTIVAYARQNSADIIVIGSRGLGNIEATLRGGVSHRVELLAKCSVLTVK